MTEQDKPEEAIFIDPRKYPSKHGQIIGKCGTYGHEQIIKEMFTEDLKQQGKGKGLFISHPEHIPVRSEEKEE